MNPRFWIATYCRGSFRAAARDPRAPIEVLRFIADEDDEFLDEQLALRHDLPLDVIRQLATRPTSWVVRARLCDNPATPEDVLRMLLTTSKYGSTTRRKAKCALLARGLRL